MNASEKHIIYVGVGGYPGFSVGGGHQWVMGSFWQSATTGDDVGA